MSLAYTDLAQNGHKSDIPATLKARREALGLSRKQVAAELDIDPSTLQRWELPEGSEFHRRIRAADHQRLTAYYDAVEGRSGIMPRLVREAPAEAPVLSSGPGLVKAARLRVHAAIAELAKDEEEEAWAMGFVDRAIEGFSSGGINDPIAPEKMAALIESTGAIVVGDLQKRRAREARPHRR